MRTRSDLPAAATLALLVIAAGWIRWAGIGREPWLDELSTAWVVGAGLGEIPPRAILGALSPLAYAPFWLSMHLLGPSEAALRLPAALAGVLAVPAAFFVAFRFSRSRAAGCVAALVVALDPAFVHFSLEARPYAMVQLAAILQLYAFVVWALRPGARGALLTAILSALLVHLHPTAALFLAAEAVALAALRLRTGPRPEALEGVPVALLVFGAFLLPLLPQALHLVTHRETLGVFVEDGTLEAALSRFQVARYLLLPPAAGALLHFALGRRLAERPALGTEAGFVLAALGTAFVVPILGAWALQSLDVARIDLERYVVSASVACALGSAVSVCLLFPRATARGLLALVAAGALWTGRDSIRNPDATHYEGSWKEMVSQLNARARPGDPIFVDSGLVENPLFESSEGRPRLYVLLPVNGLYRLADRLLEDTFPIGALDANPALQHRLASTERAAFAGRRVGLPRLERALAQAWGRPPSCEHLCEDDYLLAALCTRDRPGSAPPAPREAREESPGPATPNRAPDS